jgi:hypothetical protein
MNGLLLGLMSAFIAALFTALLTFTITTLSNRKMFKEMVFEALKSHEDKLHQDSMYQYVKSEINEHTENCPASRRFIAVERAMIFLVSKAGGNPKDFGLIGQ